MVTSEAPVRRRKKRKARITRQDLLDVVRVILALAALLYNGPWYDHH